MASGGTDARQRMSRGGEGGVASGGGSQRDARVGCTIELYYEFFTYKNIPAC